MTYRRPTNLLLRCYAECVDNQWQAFCVDLTLAAQGDTLDEARERLHAQVFDYLNEAVTIDRKHAASLLRRRAPFSSVAKFYFYGLLAKLTNVNSDHSGSSRSTLAFRDVAPLAPVACAAH